MPCPVCIIESCKFAFFDDVPGVPSFRTIYVGLSRIWPPHDFLTQFGISFSTRLDTAYNGVFFCHDMHQDDPGLVITFLFLLFHKAGPFCITLYQTWRVVTGKRGPWIDVMIMKIIPNQLAVRIQPKGGRLLVISIFWFLDPWPAAREMNE